MIQAVDTTLGYPGYHGCESKCRIRIWTLLGRSVVIASELPDNHGTSITNMVERLAAIVSSLYDIEPEGMVWIEHYPGRWDHPDRSQRDRYSIVTFHSFIGKDRDGLPCFRGVKWHHIEMHQIEEMIHAHLR